VAINGGGIGSGGTINAATLAVNVKAEGVDAAERRLKSFGDNLGAGVKKGAMIAGAALAGLAVVGVGSAIKLVSAGADLNETLSKVGVVFGDSANSVIADAQAMADKFGVPKQAFLDSAAAIGLIGKASGLAQPEAAKMSTELARLAVDAGSFYNVPLEEALGAIQSGLVGEAEPLRRFGVLLNEASVKAEALRLGIYNGNGEMTEAQKVQARTSLIMRGMTDAQGDLARTSGSVSNRVKELRGRFANWAADMGTKLLPVAGRVLDWVNNLIQRGQILWDRFRQFGAGSDEFARSLAGLVESIFGVNTESSTLGDIFIRVRDVIGTVVGKVKSVVSAMGGWRELAKDLAIVLGVITMAGVVGKVIAGVKNMLVVMKALKVAMLANPVTIWIAAIAALAAAFLILYRRNETFRNAVQRVWSFIKTTVIPIAKDVARQVLERFGQIVDFVKEVWPDIQEAIGHAMAVISAVVTTTTDVVLALWDRFGSLIMERVRIVFDYARNTVTNVLTIIQGIIKTVLAIINGDWGKAWEGIQQVVGGVWAQIKNVVGTAIALVRNTLQIALVAIRALWDNTFGALASKVGSVFATIRSTVASAVGSVVSAIGSIPGKLLSIGGTLLAAAKTVGSNIMSGIGSGIGAVTGFIGDVASKVWSGIKNFLNTNFFDKVRNFHVKIDPPGPGVLYEGNPFGGVPRLALGGVFRKPMLAQIAEAGTEAVLPLTRPGRMRSILSDPAVARAVASALPWGRIRGNQGGGAGNQSYTAIGGNVILQGSDLTPADVFAEANWQATARMPVRAAR
jgi:hypothetical protein